MTALLDITLPRGEDRTIMFTVERKDTSGAWSPLDLTIPDTKAWFTVKAVLEDPDAVAAFAFNSIDHPAKVLLNVPVSPEKNRVTVEIDAADWSGTENAILYYDLKVETDGEKFRSHRGFVKSPRGATLA